MNQYPTADRFHRMEDVQLESRVLVEKLALAWQASLLIQSGNHLVSDAFCSARLGGESHYMYGTLPAGIDSGALIQRAWPAIDG